jgi:hypothetical protein
MPECYAKWAAGVFAKDKALIERVGLAALRTLNEKGPV